MKTQVKDMISRNYYLERKVVKTLEKLAKKEARSASFYLNCFLKVGLKIEADGKAEEVEHG